MLSDQHECLHYSITTHCSGGYQQWRMLPHPNMHSARRAASRRAAGTIGGRDGRCGGRATKHDLLRPAQQQQQQQRAGLRKPSHSNLRSICAPGFARLPRRCFHVASQETAGGRRGRAAARIGFKRLDGTQLAGHGDVPASDVAAVTIAERSKLASRVWVRLYLPSWHITAALEVLACPGHGSAAQVQMQPPAPDGGCDRMHALPANLWRPSGTDSITALKQSAPQTPRGCMDPQVTEMENGTAQAQQAAGERRSARVKLAHVATRQLSMHCSAPRLRLLWSIATLYPFPAAF